MRRTTCGGCDRDDIEEFLDLGKTPLANDLPKTQDQDEKTFPLRLGVCVSCWLVQMMNVVPHEQVFGGDYTFFSGTSPGLVNYHRWYAYELLDRHLASVEKNLVVEIACNDGDLLQHFANAGHRTLGIDPALGPVMFARQQRGLNVWHESFTHELAHTVREEYGPAKLVIANHVTAHVIDLHDFLTGIYDLLADDGVAVIEVQYLPALLGGNQFDHVYHEHRYFFSYSSLAYVAHAAGLAAVDVELVPQQGTSMRVTFKRRANAVSDVRVARLAKREELVREESAYFGMQMRAEWVRESLRDLLAEEQRQGRVVAGYGMPAKATTLLNFCGITQRDVQFIVDTTPAKIGRYAPGVKIPVVGPNDRNVPDTYLVLVWNYLSGILDREITFRRDGGRFIVPIPAPITL